MQQLDIYDSSPVFLRRSSLISSPDDEEDDGFLEILDDNMEVRRGAISWAVLLSGVSLAHGNHVCSAAGRLWDADGTGELAHGSASGRQRRRGFCKLGFCSEASAGGP